MSSVFDFEYQQEERTASSTAPATDFRSSCEEVRSWFFIPQTLAQLSSLS